MKIALVWPKGFDPIYVVPLSLAYLKSNLDPSAARVRIFDCALEKMAADSPRLARRLREFSPDVVGVSCLSFNYGEARRILKTAKTLVPHAVTVMGGVHASCDKETGRLRVQEIDYLLTGEAERTFPVFIEELCKGSPDLSRVPGLVWRGGDGSVARNPNYLEQDLDLIERPDYDAIRLEEYLRRGYRYHTRRKPNAPIWVTRGCPYRCRFCSAPRMNGSTIRTHSIDYVVDWVEDLYFRKGIRLFSIIDDSFTSDMDFAKEFCRAMISLGLPGLGFATPTGIRAQRTDAELLALMKRAGWECVSVAPESGSRRTLERMGKGIDIDSFPEKVAQIRAAGLKVHGFFIVGYPGETPEDIAETSRFIRKCRFNMLYISNFQPLPGTPVYEQLVQSGEIPEGLLPGNYSDGERTYVPSALRDFNFPMFVLKEFFWLAARQPLDLVHIFRVVSPRMLLKKARNNVLNMARAMTSRGRAQQRISS